jgi:hypothetical protein
MMDLADGHSGVHFAAQALEGVAACEADLEVDPWACQEAAVEIACAAAADHATLGIVDVHCLASADAEGAGEPAGPAHAAEAEYPGAVAEEGVAVFAALSAARAAAAGVAEMVHHRARACSSNLASAIVRPAQELAE